MIYNLQDALAAASDAEDAQFITILDGQDSNEMKVQQNDILGVLPLKNMVLFPGVLLPVNVSRPKIQKLVKSAFENEKPIAVLCQHEKETEDPKCEDLYTLGTAARIVRVLNMLDQSLVVLLEGVDRIKVEEFTTTRTGIKARVSIYPEVFPAKNDKEFVAIASNIRDQALQILKGADNVAPEASLTLRSIDNPPTLVNYVCVNFGMSIAEKQELLGTETLSDRALRLLEILNKEVEMIKMKQDIQSKTKEEIDKEQRQYYLHHQLETIQKELGDTGAQVVAEMRKRAESKHWSDAVAKIFDKELEKLQHTPSHSPDYSIQQNYLDTLLDLPWNEYSEDNFDIKNARQVLDREHYGIDKVKERIIEHLAVLRQLQRKQQEVLGADEEATNGVGPAVKAPILCLYGPPGVGKTSLGKSIAEALGRKYARISLGGLHDEAEIRGHRRTYIGAMPGRIIENIRKVKTSNPVFVLDEIDKIGADYKGDPTHALLEVLDPEQNNTFHDNYLDVDYDLSKVLFIATANSLDSIPRPLLDRMELIEMTGYTQEEKIEIAKRHLIRKQQENHGINDAQMHLSDDIIRHLIDDYTRESGVRSLDRQLAALCRKIVTRIAMEEHVEPTLSLPELRTYLGQPRFSRDMYEGNNYIGVVTGLAWTAVGGEILFIEASLSPSKTPTLTLTGNLGDVMKESATLALGYIKAHAAEYGIKQKDLDTHSVHIHVPEGAVPKDGPSAGITITTALVSAFSGRKVRERIAMTGEMTLRGKVLPIGGVKEKILAAKRAGITDIILCNDNRKDIADIAESYLTGLTFHYVRDIKEVIDFAIL